MHMPPILLIVLQVLDPDFSCLLQDCEGVYNCLELVSIHRIILQITQCVSEHTWQNATLVLLYTQSLQDLSAHLGWRLDKKSKHFATLESD